MQISLFQVNSFFILLVLIILCGSSEFPLCFNTILANCQTVDTSGKLITDDVKRCSVREYMYNFSVFPERSIMTYEFLSPLRPPPIPISRIAKTTRVSERANDSDYEKSREEPRLKPQKRCAPWCATDPTIINKRCKMQQRANQTATWKTRGVR